MLTYKMTSAGEAWMNFANSKEGYNAATVRAANLEKNKDDRTDIEKNIPGARSKRKMPRNSQ